MQSKPLPGYPRDYLTKTIKPLIVAMVLFALGSYGLYRGRIGGDHLAYLIIGGVCMAGFLACIIYMMINEARQLMPALKKCPDCKRELARRDEGKGTAIHYDCKACQTRWETGLQVPET